MEAPRAPSSHSSPRSGPRACAICSGIMPYKFPHNNYLCGGCSSLEPFLLCELCTPSESMIRCRWCSLGCSGGSGSGGSGGSGGSSGGGSGGSGDDSDADDGYTGSQSSQQSPNHHVFPLAFDASTMIPGFDDTIPSPKIPPPPHKQPRCLSRRAERPKGY